jgi:hypothetical protein
LQPTHENNILDIVLCNDHFILSDINVDTPFSTSDHCTVSFQVNLMFDVNCEDLNANTVSLNVLNPFVPEYNVRLNWAKANWSLIENLFVQLHWNDFYSFLCSGPTVDEAYNYFHSTISDVCLKTIPHFKTNERKKISYPAYIRKSLITKNKHWRYFKKFPTVKNKLVYKNASARCKLLINTHSKSNDSYILNSGDINSFYKHINSKFSHKSGIGPLQNNEGGLSNNLLDKANMLNSYFASVCSSDDNKLPEFISPPLSQSNKEIFFSDSNLYKSMTNLKSKLTQSRRFPAYIF